MRLFARVLSSVIALSSTLGLVGEASARPRYVPVVAAAPRFALGAHVDVLWGNAFYPARVLAIRGDDYLIRYEGWGAQWDEWVDDSRIRYATPAVVRAEPSWFYWRGAWRTARVLERQGRWLRVTSDGWREAQWIDADTYRVGVRPAHHERPARYDAYGQDRWRDDYRPVRPNHWDDNRPAPVNDDPVVVRPNPERPEPERPNPERPEPARPNPANPNPERPEPARPNPGNPEPARPEPSAGEPTRPSTPSAPTSTPQRPPSSGDRPAGGNARPPAQEGGTATSAPQGGSNNNGSKPGGQARPTPSGGQPARPTP